MSLTMIPPAEWSERPWLYSAMLGEDIGRDLDGWAIHWPGSKASTFADPSLMDSIRRLRSWEDYHVDDKGWRGIAYDYAIDLAGRAFVLRGTGQSAATSGDYNEDGVPNNRTTDGILLILGADDRPSEAMLRSLVALIDELGGPRTYIIGHREAKGTVTTCPGDVAMGTIVHPIRRHGYEAWANDYRESEEDIMASIEELRAVVREEVRAAVDERVLDRVFTNWVDRTKEPIRMTLHHTRRDSAAGRVAAEAAKAFARAAAERSGLTEVDLAHIEAVVEEAIAGGIRITGSITAEGPDE